MNKIYEYKIEDYDFIGEIKNLFKIKELKNLHKIVSQLNKLEKKTNNNE